MMATGIAMDTFVSHKQQASIGTAGVSNVPSNIEDLEDISGLSLGDFDQQVRIHPIFKRENFPQYSSYDLVLTPLRVASVFLRSETSLRFMRTIIWGKRVKLVGEQREFTIADDILSQPLTHAQEFQTMQALGELSKLVRFEACFDMAAGSASNQPEGQKLDSRHTFAGFHSLIKFSNSFMIELQNHSERRKYGLRVDVAQELLVMFKLAQNLLHEVAHALWCAVEGGKEPFIGNGSVAEIGFAYEGFVFGGIYNFVRPRHPGSQYWDRAYFEANGLESFPRSLSDVEDMFAFTSWPETSTVREYIERGDPIAVRGKLPTYSVYTRVSLFHIAKFFSKWFWFYQEYTGIPKTIIPPKGLSTTLMHSMGSKMTETPKARPELVCECDACAQGRHECPCQVCLDLWFTEVRKKILKGVRDI